jgi:hypothetical protein
MLARLSFLLLALATIVGCENTPTEPNRSTQPMMGLKVGNEWIWQSYGLDTAGRQIDIAYDTLRIVDTASVAGETWYVADDGSQFANRADGVWMRIPALGWIFHVAKHPASVGQVFGRDTMQVTNEQGQIVDTVVSSYLVDGVGISLSVSAGTYRVNTYELRTETLDGRQLTPGELGWMRERVSYAPNVGMVERRTYHPSGMLERVTELITVRLN